MKKILAFLISLCFLLPFALCTDTPSDWAKADVETAVSLGLVPKQLQKMYQSPITREEFTQLIAALAKVWDPNRSLEEMASSRGGSWEDAVFTDTDSESVRFCASVGIVSGVGNDRFAPDDPLTRQQAAKILYTTADTLTQVVMESWKVDGMHRTPSWLMPHVYEDSAALRNWSRTPVTWCYRTGVMKGTSETTFSPDGTYTREQSIVTILRLYYLYGQANKLSPGSVDYYPLTDESGTVTRCLSSDLQLLELTSGSDTLCGYPKASVKACTIREAGDGMYALSAEDGTLLSTPYPTLLSCGDGLYLGLVEGRTYDVLYCDAAAGAVAVTRAELPVEAKLYPLAGGLFALQSGYDKIDIYDLFGANYAGISMPYSTTILSADGSILTFAWTGQQGLRYAVSSGVILDIPNP